MKKKLCMLLSIAMVIGICSGCGMVQRVKIDKNGSIKTRDEVYLSKNEIEDGIDATISGVEITEENYKGKKKVNGVTYSVYADKWEKMDDEEDDDSYIICTKTKFIMDIPANIEDERYDDSDIEAIMYDALSSGIEFYKIKVTFPKEITKTNGKLSKDKKTVTFDYFDAVQNNVKLYAYTNKK